MRNCHKLRVTPPRYNLVIFIDELYRSEGQGFADYQRHQSVAYVELVESLTLVAHSLSSNDISYFTS